ncbi:MAG: T9SS type A sorting domain-containing protein [Bacteroidia bacterium]
MKNIYTLILICFSLTLKAQVNRDAGLSENDLPPVPPLNEPGAPVFKNESLIGITCTPNTFWGISGSQVSEYAINGGVITNNGIIVSATSPGNSLSFCNNLSGGAFSPTFYSHSASSAAYYDGAAWLADPATSNCSLSNSAGAGNYLYYNSYGASCLDKYDGTSFTQVYSAPQLKFTIADLAVDDAGNAWCLMGLATPNTDSIMVISPTGQVIKQYPFSMNTLNGYGCFLLNGILYVGLGGGNPNTPNTMLPISFVGNSAIAGTPISFTNGSLDLASCNAGTPLSIDAPLSPPGNSLWFTIQPTIVTDHISCFVTTGKNLTAGITIHDAVGKLLYSEQIRNPDFNSKKDIDVKLFSKGIYFVTVNDGKDKVVKKFVKE